MELGQPFLGKATWKAAVVNSHRLKQPLQNLDSDARQLAYAPFQLDRENDNNRPTFFGHICYGDEQNPKILKASVLIRPVTTDRKCNYAWKTLSASMRDGMWSTERR